MRSGSTGSPAVSSSSRRREARGNRHGIGGFSLIEVLAALVILALGLGTLYSTFNTALSAAGRADGHLSAMQLAQSLLDVHTAGRALKPGATRGRQDPYQWQVMIEPADEELTPPVQAGDWLLHRLVVTVSWPRQRQVRLETLHLAKPP